MKNKVYSIFIILFSILCGVITGDYFLGTFALMFSMLNAYYASVGKIYNYFFGAIFSIINGYISYINGLYGLAILCFILYFPSQIQGYFSWKKATNNNEVKVRGFNFKTSIIVVISSVFGSLLLGFILSKIPGQQLAFLDASSNIINIYGIVLMNLRFKECWVVWLFNNVVDLSIWSINFVKGSPNSTMMLVVSIGYLMMNIYGLIKWIKMTNNGVDNIV